jgi:error-prone DNA polymerase
MPERPDPKPRQHPFAEFYREPMLRSLHAALAQEHSPPPPPPVAEGPPKRRAVASPAYAELQVTSNFTFLTGASHPDELIEQAAAMGHAAIAITDRNSLAGIVRAHVAAKELGMPLVVGCRLSLKTNHPDQPPGAALPILVYPTDAASYGRLCRLLTLGKRRAPKGQCDLSLHDLMDHGEGLLAIVVPSAILNHALLDVLEGLRGHFSDDRLSLASSLHSGEEDRARLHQLAALSEHTRIPLVATNDVHYHAPERRPLQDVLMCIRHGCTMEQAGLRLFPNAERRLKPPDEMARLFAEHPRAIHRSVEIARRATGFSLDQLRYQYPDEVCPAGRTAIRHLAELAYQGAAERYPRDLPGGVRAQIEHELTLIDELNYAPYFLTVHDLVTFARGRGILCQGRGAAANSAVCYALGITAVDPDRINLLFERFISKERNEPPDIDVDFEHERREEVIQYLYGKYGRERAALTAEVISYRGRSAVREVGKAMGLSLDAVDRLAKDVDWWSDRVTRADRIKALGLDPTHPAIRMVMRLAQDILGFPRHLSQHVGGFVITRGPLCEMVPVENAAMPDRTVIEWDKDDIDAMGMLKVDVLGLGMLTCVRKAFGLVEEHHGRALTLASVPAEDPAVYDMIGNADTIGVFQIESRAQMTMLPRLRPRQFYDLVIEVAIVRPGPIQGDMVHPYLRRRNQQEDVTYPDAKVEAVLGRTLGVPLFQEQAMALAVVAAGFTPGEADQLRRAMAAWKRQGDQFARFEAKFVNGMLERGYPREFADRCFRQLRGFSEYGFPESHAASFALIVYVSAWLKKHYPAAFAAALINSQPMGFYAPAQIVRDAQEHGVEVRPVDVNHSQWDCTLEASASGVKGHAHGSPALRLGMRLVKGLRESDAQRIVGAVQECGAFASIDAIHAASSISIAALRRLAAADAFGSMGLDRQSALWHARKLRDDPSPLFSHVEQPVRNEPALPPVAAPRRVIDDYASIGLSLKAHPVAFLRDQLTLEGVTPAHDLSDERLWPHGSPIVVAGLVLVRQRPATASGIVFMTLEDETGIANLIVRPTVYERHRRAARHGVVVLGRGTVERQGAVVHVLTTSLDTLDGPMADLVAASRDFH